MKSDRQRFAIIFSASVLLLTFISGCAAPGSSIAQARISGRLINSQGRGISDQQIDITLPAEYGLAGLDAIYGEPKDYGHYSQHVTLQTDGNGSFFHTFSPNTYSITVWLIPPLGAFPRHPPEPYFMIGTSAVKPDFFVVAQVHGHFDYRVWDHDSRKLIKDSASRIVGTYCLTNHTWQLNLTLNQP